MICSLFQAVKEVRNRQNQITAEQRKNTRPDIDRTDVVFAEKNNTKTSATSPLSGSPAQQGSVGKTLKSVTAAAENLGISGNIAQLSEYVKNAILSLSNISDAIKNNDVFNGHKINAGNFVWTLVQNGIKAREYLESLGYDGVNNEDQEFIAFHPEQIKSADLVTYDNNGEIIPLSELYRQNTSLAQKVTDWVGKFFSKLRQNIGKGARSNEAAWMADAMDELQQKWEAALRVAAENQIKLNGIEGIKNTATEGGVQYSFANTTSGMANDKLGIYPDELKTLIESRGDVIVDSYQKLLDIVNEAFDNTTAKKQHISVLLTILC